MPEQLHESQPFRVAVFADFVCPYSYLAVEQIDRLAREYELECYWRPHWLHPETPPEGMPRDSDPESVAKIERLHAWVKEMAPETYPRMRFPEKRQYSFRAFEALEFAYDRGLDLPYKTALYELMWSEGCDIAETATLVTAAHRAGLDADEMELALHTRGYAQRAMDAVNQARRIGITNTPTLILGKTRINGWHYYEVLQTVLDKQGAPRRAQPADADSQNEGARPEPRALSRPS
jgi:predicted DsbA family dithiol-disulfide isomerase